MNTLNPQETEEQRKPLDNPSKGTEVEELPMVAFQTVSHLVNAPTGIPQFTCWWCKHLSRSSGLPREKAYLETELYYSLSFYLFI